MAQHHLQHSFTSFSSWLYRLSLVCPPLPHPSLSHSHLCKPRIEAGLQAHSGNQLIVSPI